MRSLFGGFTVVMHYFNTWSFSTRLTSTFSDQPPQLPQSFQQYTVPQNSLHPQYATACPLHTNKWTAPTAVSLWRQDGTGTATTTAPFWKTGQAISPAASLSHTNVTTEPTQITIIIANYNDSQKHFIMIFRTIMILSL